MKQILKDLNPIWFVRESWKYMRGEPRWKTVLMMPIAYLNFAQDTIFDR